MSTLFPDFKPGDLGDCVLSPCGLYRYTLWRKWSDGPRYAQVVGLNPSKADGQRNDQTMHKVIAIFKNLGFDALCMMNAYAYRATDPKEMRKAEDPIGPDNDEWLKKIAADAAIHVVCWGGEMTGYDRGREVVHFLRKEFWCFGLTKHGEPLHPLFLKATTPLQRYYGV